MKLNWGKSIVLAFILFMGFILFFVFKVQSNSKYDNELVTQDYYKKESLAQSDIDKQNNANALKNKVAVNQTAEGITVTFPTEFDYKEIKGKISLYRPSSQKLDFEVPISLSSPHLLIPKSVLADGRWDISIDWNYKGNLYLNKETISM